MCHCETPEAWRRRRICASLIGTFAPDLSVKQSQPMSDGVIACHQAFSHSNRDIFKNNIPSGNAQVICILNNLPCPFPSVILS